jgi:hypothetical protein
MSTNENEGNAGKSNDPKQQHIKDSKPEHGSKQQQQRREEGDSSSKKPVEQKKTADSAKNISSSKQAEHKSGKGEKR